MEAEEGDVIPAAELDTDGLLVFIKRAGPDADYQIGIAQNLSDTSRWVLITDGAGNEAIVSPETARDVAAVMALGAAEIEDKDPLTADNFADRAPVLAVAYKLAIALKECADEIDGETLH